MNKVIKISMILLLSGNFILGDTIQSEGEKAVERQNKKNLLRVARIIQGDTWFTDTRANKISILTCITEEGVSRFYPIGLFINPQKPVPSWRIKDGYFIGTAAWPLSNGLGHMLMRWKIADGQEIKSVEDAGNSKEKLKLSSVEYIDVLPLVPEVSQINNLDEVVHFIPSKHFDFVINDNGIITLINLTMKGELEIWEIDSNGQWTSMSDKTTLDTTKKWKLIMKMPAPLTSAFVARVQHEKLYLTTELREVWEFQGKKTFHKITDSVSDKGNRMSLVVEDVDSNQVWFAHSPNQKSTSSEWIYQIRDIDKKPSK